MDAFYLWDEKKRWRKKIEGKKLLFLPFLFYFLMLKKEVFVEKRRIFEKKELFFVISFHLLKG